LAKEPLKDPTAVRAAEAMTIFVMGVLPERFGGAGLRQIYVATQQLHVADALTYLMNGRRLP
jgi:hypothetical protein